jgi:hypothetical protein
VSTALPLRLSGAGAASGAAFGPMLPVADLTLASLVTYGSDRVAVFGNTGSLHPHAAATFGTPGGFFNPPRPLGPNRDSFVIAAAADAAGDTAALLRVCESDARCSHAAPYLVTRRRGGSFTRGIKLDHGPTVGGDVALDARGDVLVAWERPVKGSTGTRGIYRRVYTSPASRSPARRRWPSGAISRTSRRPR